VFKEKHCKLLEFEKVFAIGGMTKTALAEDSPLAKWLKVPLRRFRHWRND